MILDGKFLTTLLEDGEKVVRLRGGRDAGSWKSSRPHAGYWGSKTSYILIPCRDTRQTKNRSKRLVRTYPGLEMRGGDIEVLALGEHDLIEKVLSSGPEWVRALRSRKGQPRSDKQIAASEALARRSK